MAIRAVSQSGLSGFTKYRSLADASGNPTMLAPGMVLMKPTSIAHSGTSATLGANGQVTFSGVTSLSLNGVFAADFDNYVIAWRGEWDAGSGGIYIEGRMRSAGADASGANYTNQELRSSGSTVSGFRSTGATSALIGGINAANRSGVNISVYGPYLAQPTAFRAVDVDGTPTIADHASTHSLSTSYDGITLNMFFSTTGSTGAVAVYGIRS